VSRETLFQLNGTKEKIIEDGWSPMSEIKYRILMSLASEPYLVVVSLV
jgi:hypothetical protein